MLCQMLKKFLVTTGCALTLGIPMAIGMEKPQDPHGQPSSLLGKQAHDQKNFVPAILGMFKDFRQFYTQHGHYTPHGDRALLEPHYLLKPFAERLLTIMQKDSESPAIAKLTKQVKRALKESAVSAAWLIDAHFRYLTLLSDMSEEEKDIFTHIPHNNYLKALLEKDIYGNSVVLDVYKWAASVERLGGYFDTQGREIPYTPGLSLEAIQKIQEAIARDFPLPILYPALEEGLFHPHLILNCWMEGIYPLGMPLKTVKKVHGADASPLGFAFHDLFHFKQDDRPMALAHHTHLLAARYASTGGFVSGSLPALVPLVVQKYFLLMNALKKAYESVEQDPHAVTGLFFLTHEFPFFDELLFRLDNPNHLIYAMLQGSLGILDHEDAWENPDDLLQTSPLTGESACSDQGIKRIAFLRALQDKSLELPADLYFQQDAKGKILYVSTEDERQMEKEKWLQKFGRWEIRKTRNFIDAILELPSGEKKTYTFPTLYRKWKNLDASAGMLKFAGINLNAPHLHDSEEAREQAIGFLQSVRSKIQETMKDFVLKARVFFDASQPSSEAYATTYKKRFDWLDSQIEWILTPRQTDYSSLGILVQESPLRPAQQTPSQPDEMGGQMLSLEREGGRDIAPTDATAHQYNWPQAALPH